MEDKIKQKMEQVFAPEFMEIINESRLHAGHAGDDGSGQTHFRLVMVSAVFEGQGRLQRQRGVMESLKDFFPAGLHALSLSLFSPAEHKK